MTTTTHFRRPSGPGPARALLLAAALVPALLACRASGGDSTPAPAASAAVRASALEDHRELAAEVLRRWFAAHPVRATENGIHDHDARLPDRAPEAVGERIAELDELEQRLAGVDATLLPSPEREDHRILLHAMAAERLELARVRGWQRDPRHYVSRVARGLASLSERRFAPLPERLGSMTERLRAVPRFLAEGRANLVDVPPLWAELAQGDARGALTFLAADLSDALEEEGLARVAPSVREPWEHARRLAVDALTEWIQWLEGDLTPRAGGDFRLGEELFLEKLRLEEFVDLDADALWEKNEAAIARYRARVAEAAALVDPARTPGEVMELVTRDHPSADALVATARAMVDDARSFCIDKELLTLPSERVPTVRATPGYMRMGFASMSTPGPFEHVATEAFYNVTNVDPEWSAERQAQHLTYFNRAGLLGITVHEAFPGHFVQLLWEEHLPTDVRRVFTPRILVEGWAHYTEEMMIDEGLGGGDPRIRLGQLRRALQRHARWYAGLALHVRGEPVEAVAKRYAEIAYFAEFPALREVQRGTSDATYLYYALGRMQIFELRETVRAELEAAGRPFSLRAFHDWFLGLGLPAPLALDAFRADPDALTDAGLAG